MEFVIKYDDTPSGFQVWNALTGERYEDITLIELVVEPTQPHVLRIVREEGLVLYGSVVANFDNQADVTQ